MKHTVHNKRNVRRAETNSAKAGACYMGNAARTVNSECLRDGRAERRGTCVRVRVREVRRIGPAHAI